MIKISSKPVITSFLIIVLIIIILLLSQKINHLPKQACFQDNCFKLEIAQTPEERAQGLMNRDFLAQDSGMLFIFESPGYYKFWMKNTLIALDIIWLNKEKEVIHIETAQPCFKDSCPSYGPEKESMYVLELNAGTAEKIGLKAGDKIII